MRDAPVRRRLARLDPEPLEHADEQVGERGMLRRVEREMAAVLEAAARQEDRKVLHGVVARVPQVAAEEDHRPV